MISAQAGGRSTPQPLSTAVDNQYALWLQIQIVLPKKSLLQADFLNSDIFLSSASINSPKTWPHPPLLPTWKFSWLFVNPCCAFNPYVPCRLQAQTGLSRSRLVPSFQYNQVLSLCCLRNTVLLGQFLKKHSMSLASSHGSPNSHHALPFRMSIQNWACPAQSAVWRESQTLLSCKARDTN